MNGYPANLSVLGSVLLTISERPWKKTNQEIWTIQGLH